MPALLRVGMQKQAEVAEMEVFAAQQELREPRIVAAPLDQSAQDGPVDPHPIVRGQSLNNRGLGASGEQRDHFFIEVVAPGEGDGVTERPIRRDLRRIVRFAAGV